MIHHRPRFILTALVALSLAIIAWLTLVPMPWQEATSSRTPWYCVVCGAEGAVDVLQNIALFMPFGLALVLRGFRPSRALLIGLLVSITIELLQATVVTGRDASLSDVITNSAGTLAGAALGLHAGQLWLPSVPRARQLMLAAASSWLAVMMLAAFGLTADRPNGTTRLVDAPLVPVLDPFRGIVVRSTVDSANGSLSLAADVRTAGFSDRLAPVLELQDAGSAPVARIGQLGQKPTFSRRLRATRALFRTPMVLIYGGVIPAAPASVHLAGGVTGPVLWSSATINGTQYRAELARTPGLGWMLLLPLQYPFDIYARWTSAAWVALPLLLAGFWAGRARLPISMTLAGAALLLAAGLEGTAWLFHLARDGTLAWIAGLVAVWGSWVMGFGIPKSRRAGQSLRSR